MFSRKAAFLDRDGVINRVPPSGHVACPDEFEFLPDAPSACKILIEKGFEIVVVTNQGGIARGYYTMDEYLAVNDRMLAMLSAEKIKVLDVFSVLIILFVTLITPNSASGGNRHRG